jgi:rhamnogalacturonan endolyase
MAYTRQRVLQLGAIGTLGLLVPAVSLTIADITRSHAASSAASPVSLSVSGMDATISNGIFTVKFNSSGTGYSFVYNGTELIGPAKGFYSSVNGTQDFSPTQLQVITNTPEMVDISYISSWGALHYIVRSGVSGLYS